MIIFFIINFGIFVFLCSLLYKKVLKKSIADRAIEIKNEINKSNDQLSLLNKELKESESKFKQVGTDKAKITEIYKKLLNSEKTLFEQKTKSEIEKIIIESKAFCDAEEYKAGSDILSAFKSKIRALTLDSLEKKHLTNLDKRKAIIQNNLKKLEITK